MKFRLIIFTFFALPFILKSQNYIPLLNNINEWKVTSCETACITDTYYTDGDTIVNGLNYKILYGFHYISRSFLIREDVLEKKVYLMFANNTSVEYLLYNFSLTVGDTFEIKNPISPFALKGGFFQVDSIVPKILEDGLAHNFFHLSPTPSNTFSINPCVWVEGIGSLSLINAPGGAPNINQAGQLSCFYKNTNLIYSNLDSIERCEPSHFVNTTSIKEISKQVSYNIQDQILSIASDSKILSFELYNLNGYKVLGKYKINNQKVDQNINILNTGIYFIKIHTINQAYFVSKFCLN